MGHWRLHYPFAYGRALGYKYLLQIDTDSNFLETIECNLVKEMEEGNFDMGGRIIIQDQPTWGLPELTRYFLVTEQIMPATLFDHCNPKNIDGLYTLSSTTFPKLEPSSKKWRVFDPDNRVGKGGWSQTVIYGNFIIYNLEFWYREDVQKYFNFVTSTGGHFRFRWNEQAVVAMIWQIFVPEERFKLFSFRYSHDGIS